MMTTGIWPPTHASLPRSRHGASDLKVLASAVGDSHTCRVTYPEEGLATETQRYYIKKKRVSNEDARVL